MDAKVVVDTSIWIAFFRGKDFGLTERIATLLKSGRAVYTGIIALELINGAKGQKELQILYDAFDSMPCIPASEITCLHAGKLGYELARKGHTLSTVDLLIAQTAIENNLFLMTYDEHFNVIAKHSSLTLFK
ncbi:MAG: PIN domain-containing protein [Nitrospirae bacterium]|nr:PIN domain-containing protein [Nitrospirota bacterium]MCL5237065.1 PIN domain-containing protein [Nitrospirota bacterium]